MHRTRPAERTEQRERRALFFVAASFFLIAAYVLWEAASALWWREAPEATIVGLVLAAVSLVVMPALEAARGEDSADD